MSDDIALKIGIGTPYIGPLPARYAQCKSQMTAALGMLPIMATDGSRIGFGIKDYMVPGSILAAQRNEIVDKALEDDCSHLLWVDGDQTFPADTLHRLLGHNVDFVGCNIARKSIPSEPTAFDMDGKPLFTRRHSAGLVRVKQVGTGLLLMRTHLFRLMLARFNKPVFAFPWDQNRQLLVGEDTRMCHRLDAMGVEMWVDHDLSKQVGHIGDFEYRHEHIPGYYEPERVADPVAVPAG